MITEEDFNLLLADIVKNNESISMFSPNFAEFKDMFNGFEEINNNKTACADANSKMVQLGYLFSMRWGILTLSVSQPIPEDENSRVTLMFQGLFALIANSVLAIIKLSIDGLDYQANVLLRNLYELCFILLNVIIDTKKRYALLDADYNENEYKVWKQYFTFSKLDSTIKEYENKIASIEEDSFMNTWRKNNYHFYSSYAHNDFSSFLAFSYSNPKTENDLMHPNIWGHFATRTDNIIGSMNSLLWYTELLFAKLLADKDIDIDKNSIVGNSKEDKDFWNQASFLGLFATRYYWKIRSDEAE